MASSLTHLGAARRIMDRTRIEQPERFRLGQILPDCSAVPAQYTKRTHYRKVDPETGIRIFDLLSFRKEYGHLLEDDLYLGYYCHLIQDAVFRWFCFAHKRLQDLVPVWDHEATQKMYHDYSLQNRPLIDRYEIKVPEDLDLAGEPILTIAPMEVGKFLMGIREYYTTPAPEPPEPFLYSLQDTEEFLDIACEACIKEIEAVKQGAPRLTGREWEYSH